MKGRAPADGGTGISPPPGRPSLKPLVFSYLINPPALVAILLLRRYGAIERETVTIYVCTFVAIPVIVGTFEYFFQQWRTPLLLQIRIVLHVTAVTFVIYLVGWGPVSLGAYMFIALENIWVSNSRTWRSTTAWSLVGIAIGQVAIAQHWAPSELKMRQAQTLGVMGSFVLIFVIYMAGAIAREKERAEASLRANEERFRSLVLHSTDTILMVGKRGRITYASPAIEALLGRSPDDVQGMMAFDLVHPDDHPLVNAALRDQPADSPTTEPVQFRMPHADGSWPHVEALITDFRSQPSVGSYIVNLRDITERKEAEARLAHQALHDPLTGLSNRVLVLGQAEAMLVEARRTRVPVVALFIDLDDFKTINDDLGHGMGDELLILAAARLRTVVRNPDAVGRVGGDEFVVLVEGSSDVSAPELVAQRLIQTLGAPYRLGEWNYTVTVSIGISVGIDQTVEELLRDADVALYQAKAAGKNVAVLFDPEASGEMQDRIDLKNDLREALEHDQLRLVYQPIMKLDGLSVSSIEALLRWDHPTRGLIMPLDFIVLAEDTSTIVDVGRWVLFEACRTAAGWQRPGFELPVAVNLSGRQLRAPSLLTDIEDALSESGLPAGMLICEITETVLMNNAKALIARLKEMDTIGVRLAIDDFGTGHSSLNYLRELPIDILKIDRSLISAVGSSNEAALLVHTLVALGQALNLETVAEGIENETQLAALRTERCETAQGFFFTQPLDPDDLDRFLRDLSAGEEEQLTR